MSEIHAFKATLHLFEDNLWFYHFLVPDVISEAILNGKSGRRVLCTLQEAETFHCSLMPDGLGSWFINVNQKVREKLKINEGMTVSVQLAPDTSQFGMPMPEEFEETLLQDLTAKNAFDQLTPGKQRNLIYIVNQVKSPNIKLRRALVVSNHLLSYPKIDFKALNAELKESNRQAKR